MEQFENEVKGCGRGPKQVLLPERTVWNRSPCQALNLTPPEYEMLLHRDGWLDGGRKRSPVRDAHPEYMLLKTDG